MAVSLLSHEVSDLCLGKPALRSLSISATVGDALSALKTSGENYLSVWSCENPSKKKIDGCLCLGKICMVDVVCYLCREENLLQPSSALKSPVTVLMPEIPGLVRHVEPHFSLLEALDLILEGAQNLVVPILTSSNSRKKLLGREFCWLTQEDVVRFLLNSIGLFYQIAALSVKSLGIIRSQVFAIEYHEPASALVDSIVNALSEQTSVAVVTDDGKLIGEISPVTLAGCDETVAPAIVALSAGDLMAYIDCGGPSEDMVRAVKAKLKERNLEGMIDLLEEYSSYSSSDEEETSLTGHPLVAAARPVRYSRSGSYSARMVRRSEAIVCHPRSSLMAVMIQALAHRVNYVWVIEDDYSLVGIVTLSDVLKVFREHLHS